jgi:hypothetical protein
MKPFKILILLLSLFSCQDKKYRYKISGYTEINGNEHETIWYVDTFDLKNDTVYYTNSDGSQIKIDPPFIIKHL